MKRILISLCLSLTAGLCLPVRTTRCVEDFNFDWRFILGDSIAYSEPGFDDSGWRPLHLPHDWAIEGEFSADNPSTPNGGALPGGVGWYRKVFPTPEGTGPERRVYVEFDGVFMNSTVFVNGREVGTRPYGYSSFSYEITDYLTGGSNLIAVRCDNAEQPNSRWYSGCGIYRNVRLVTVNPVHIAYNGVYVTTPEVTPGRADVHVECEVEGNPRHAPAVRIFNDSGRKVAKARTIFEDGVWKADLVVRKPLLWDVDDTHLYTAEVLVRGLDSYRQKFGIRTMSWDPEKGFFLNGRKLMLLGCCQHHDMGCIGSAVHRRALERQLGILREMGCNAIRSSHNPPAPELLDLCDEMGFVVIDEAMDMWRKRKTTYDYSRFFDEWHEKDMRDFMKRDRNHPCVILWSIGNEVLEQWNSSDDIVGNLTPEQANTLINFMSSLPQYKDSSENYNSLLARHMVSIMKDMDATRPVTAGLSETLPVNNLIRSGAIDVYGFNYHTCDYDSLNVWYPGKVIFGSEIASGLSSRGFYPQPSDEIRKVPYPWWIPYESEHHQCPSYDNTYAPWSDTHQHAWASIKSHPYMAGCFLWTGFDYLGECTPYTWPSRSSYFGVVDMAGFPKDAYYLYQSEWTDNTVLHLFPHWNWSEGDRIDLWCYYNNADEVELFLNGRSLGRSRKEGEKLRAQWNGVEWEKGTVEAVSYKDGVEVARDSRTSTGEPVSLVLTPDRRTLAADGYDLCFVTVEAADADGRIVPDAVCPLRFGIEGPGELYGVDNGNAAGNLCLKGDTMPLFAGKALAVIRSVKDVCGDVTLRVSSGQMSAETSIEVK